MAPFARPAGSRGRDAPGAMGEPPPPPGNLLSAIPFRSSSAGQSRRRRASQARCAGKRRLVSFLRLPDAYLFVKSVAGTSLPLVTVLDAGTLAFCCGKGKGPARGRVLHPGRMPAPGKEGKGGLVIRTREKTLAAAVERRGSENTRRDHEELQSPGG